MSGLRKRGDTMPRATDPARDQKTRPYNTCPLCGASVPFVKTGNDRKGRYCSVEHRRQHTMAKREAEIRESARVRAGIARPYRLALGGQGYDPRVGKVYTARKEIAS